MPTYLPNAEPFFFPGHRVGCLLIHGFTGTPYEVRELGARLAARGYTAWGPALAGHATRLQDLYDTTWHDWYATAVAAYAQLARTCDTIFPIGLSMGGALALHLAAHRPVAGVVVVSTPFTIHNPLIPLFRIFPFLQKLVPQVNKNPKRDDTHDPRVRSQHPEYRAYPIRAAKSFILDFLPHLRADLREVAAPALLIQARGDSGIPRDSMEQFHARLGSREKEMVWIEPSGHLVLEDYGKEEAFERILQFIARHVSKGGNDGTL